MSTEAPAAPVPLLPHLIGAASALGVALLLVHGLFLAAIPISHDAGIYLESALLLLDGQLPYVDYVETNPPWAHYLHTLPVLLSRLTGISLPTAFLLWVSAGVAASSLGLWRLCAGARPPLPLSNRLLVLTASLGFSLFALYDNGFGQREHLFVLALLPWSLCRAQRHSDGGSPDLAGGLALGLGTAAVALQKPHFVLILGAVELLLLARSRRPRLLLAPEAVAALAVGLGYGLHVLWLPEAMRDAFFGRWLPMLAAHYDTFNAPLSGMLLVSTYGAVIPIMVAAATLSILAGRRLSGWVGALGLALGLASAVGVVSFFVQHKGWNYHIYPTLGCSLLQAALLVGTLPARRIRPDTLACLTVLVLSALLLRGAESRGDYWRWHVRDLVSAIERTTVPGDRVAFISAQVAPAFPVLTYADRRPGTRYLQAFPIPFFYEGEEQPGAGPYRYPPLPERSVEERDFLHELGSDIVLRRPELVFIQAEECRVCPRGFVITDYLAEGGWIDEYLIGYHPVGSLRGYDAYRRTRRPRHPARALPER